MSMRGKNILATVSLIVLLLLLPAAAVLQTVWLNQASHAEADRLRRALSNATRQIRADLAIELASLRALVNPLVEEPAELEPFERVEQVFPEFYDVWRTQSRFPELVGDVVFISLQPEPEVFAYDAVSQTFVPVEEPEPWVYASLRHRFGVDTVPEPEPLTPQELTLLVPLAPDVQRIREPDGRGAVRVVETGVLLFRLDLSYLAAVVVPQLVETYLGTSDYHAWLGYAGESEPLWSSPAQQDGGASITTKTADEVLSLSPAFGGILVPEEVGPDGQSMVGAEVARRFLDPVLQQWLTLRGRGEPEPLGRLFDADGENALVLLFRHSAGSINAAARLTRNRNLAVSYAALLGLVGAVVVFYLMYRRANRQREREHEFVSTVTHELRTPIAAIHAAADNLAGGFITEPEQVRTYGTAMLDEGRRLKTMIEQILLYAGLRGSRKPLLTSIRVDKTIAQACLRVPELPRNRLTVRIEPNLPVYRGDPVAIESIVTNLLSNAAKHNDESVSVVLKVRLHHHRTGPGNRCSLIIEVIDDGAGIPRSELKRVREPFFRGAQSQSDQVPGSGLGLSLVERIAETYGGKLDIESAIGAGTTVSVTLPFEHGDGHER